MLHPCRSSYCSYSAASRWGNSGDNCPEFLRQASIRAQFVGPGIRWTARGAISLLFSSSEEIRSAMHAQQLDLAKGPRDPARHSPTSHLTTSGHTRACFLADKDRLTHLVGKKQKQRNLPAPACLGRSALLALEPEEGYRRNESSKRTPSVFCSTVRDARKVPGTVGIRHPTPLPAGCQQDRNACPTTRAIANWK